MYLEFHIILRLKEHYIVSYLAFLISQMKAVRLEDLHDCWRKRYA